MKTRMLATLIVSWGLIGVPALCHGGMLVECCEDACPDEDGPSQPRECSSCIALCNATVSPSNQNGGPDVEPNVPVAGVAVAPIMIRREILHERNPAWLAQRPRRNLPYPVPDRPLLV